MKAIFNFVILVLFTSLSHAGIIEGGMDSSGGSGSAAEFISIGRDLAVKLDSLKGFPVTTAQLLAVIQKTKIEFTQDDLGNEKIQRLPEQSLIRLSPDLWSTDTPIALEKKQLVLHQYLLYMGVNDSNYQWTYFVLDGGRAILTFECKTGFFNGETVSLRQIDVDDDGQSEGYAATLIIRSLIFGNMQSLINLIPTKQGLVLNWLEVTGGVHMLLRNEDLAQPSPFTAEINKIVDYRQDGTPVMKVTGTLTCKPINP